MQITIILNGTRVSAEAAPDTLLIDFVRSHGCYSVKRGCETANCGLCTVFLDDNAGAVLLGAGSPCRRPRASPRWRACRTKPQSSARSSPIRERSSAASATPASS